MDKLKRIGLGLLVLAIVGTASAFTWSLVPAQADASRPDPTVVHANKLGANDHPFRESYFEYAGHSLHYVEAGEGDLVLFIHGFPSYWFSFIRQMEALKSDYRVVAIDGLAAGKSDAPLDVDVYKLKNMAAHVHALIDHLGAETVHIVGHDWGATFAFGFAQRYPDRVASVTGLSAPPQNALLNLLRSDPALRKTSDYIERLKKANPLLIVALGGDKQVWKGAFQPLVEKGYLTVKEGEIFRKPTGNPKRIDAHINWYRANIPAFDAIENKDFWPSRDARLTTASQIIWGENDRVFAREYAAAATAAADDMRILPLKDVGHWPQFERPEIVTEAIARLIAENVARD